MAFDFQAAIYKLIEASKSHKKDVILAIRTEGIGGASVYLGADERKREVLAFCDTLEEAVQVATERLTHVPIPPVVQSPPKKKAK